MHIPVCTGEAIIPERAVNLLRALHQDAQVRHDDATRLTVAQRLQEALAPLSAYAREALESVERAWGHAVPTGSTLLRPDCTLTRTDAGWQAQFYADESSLSEGGIFRLPCGVGFDLVRRNPRAAGAAAHDLVPRSFADTLHHYGRDAVATEIQH